MIFLGFRPLPQHDNVTFYCKLAMTGPINGEETVPLDTVFPRLSLADDFPLKYKLLEKIGEGGFGEVWRAEQQEPVRRRVAIKILKLGMDTREVVARFEAERQALALMEHPGIAKALDAGATRSGRPFFVMELVKGIPITEYCEANKLSIPARLALFREVCHAIQHAHQKGVIHRDIKPSNILVSILDGQAVPKVIDFGIAKAMQQQLTDKTVVTHLEQFIGTPAYMSPEQAEMKCLDIDTRSDVYSLGVLLYELLSGDTPFDTRQLMTAGIDEMRRIIREVEPSRPSVRVRATTIGSSHLPKSLQKKPTQPPTVIEPDLDWIVMKCLEKDRSRRYETTNALATDIGRYMRNEPVAARPPTASYRLQKAWRRNKMAFSAAAAVTLAILVGLAASVWQATAATRAKNLALQAEAARSEEARIAQGQRDRAIAAESEASEQRRRAELERDTASRLLYIANMNMLQQAWDKDNLPHVRQLLFETASYPNKGFEWFFWQNEVHRERKVFRGHRENVTAAVFSPDTSRLYTGSEDGTIKVWDVASGEEIFTFEADASSVFALAVSPDGRRILSGGEDMVPKLWDAESGKLLLSLLKQRARVVSAAFSADGAMMLTSAWGEYVANAWETHTGKELLKVFSLGVLNSGRSSFSPDGARILTGGLDGTPRVWNLQTGAEMLRFQGHAADANAVSFSHDGKRVVTGSYDHTARIWDSADGKLLFTLHGHRGPVIHTVFSHDDRRILTASHDRTARVWETDSGRETHSFKHDAPLTSANFSADGSSVVTSSGRSARIWSLEPGANRKLMRHADRLTAGAVSTDGKWLLTGSEDGTIHLWNRFTCVEQYEVLAHDGGISALAFSHDSSWYASVGGFDQLVKTWHRVTGKSLLTMAGHTAPISALAVSPGGNIATAGEDRTIRVWDSATGKPLLTLAVHESAVTSLDISDDGTLIASADRTGSIHIFNAADGKRLHSLSLNEAISKVRFLPGKNRLLVASAEGPVAAWNFETGVRETSFTGHIAEITALGVSPDGQRIATATRAGTAKLWDAGTGRELLTLPGHQSRVSSILFSPQGEFIITTSHDRKAILWETATPAEAEAFSQEEKRASDTEAVWRAEKFMADAARRAERQADIGAIKDWLVLLPIPAEPKVNSETLTRHQLPFEGAIEPRPGQTVKIGSAERVWREVHQYSHLLDFRELAGRQFEFAVAYAVTYIHSPTGQTDLKMLVGCDDLSRVYLNGELLFERTVGGPFIEDEHTVGPVTLRPGWNTLVFKVVNFPAGWMGSVRLTRADGKPPEGISISVTRGQPISP